MTPEQGPLHIRVREGDGVRDFDAHAAVAQNHDGATLQVPRSIRYGGYVGRSVAFGQLISTWANKSDKPHIRTTLPRDSQEKHERFVSRIHGLAAAYYAHQITADDDQTNLRPELLYAAKPRIDAMGERRLADVAKGQLTELVFVHHAHQQFHSATYQRRPTVADLMDPQRHGRLVVPPREMNALISNALEDQHLPPSDFQLLAPLLENRECPLGRLLHEVFRNTAEHAYLDKDGRIPQKGLRCLLIAHRTCQPDSLQTHALTSADHPNLDLYFGRIRDRAGLGNRKLVHLLELSVLDTGPGFANTIRQNPFLKGSDVVCVEQCFADHQSSKLGPNSGLGLGRVLSHVNSLDGFIRVRTSTTEAFFSSSTTSRTNLIPHVACGLPEVCGTTLTIAIPLGL